MAACSLPRVVPPRESRVFVLLCPPPPRSARRYAFAKKVYDSVKSPLLHADWCLKNCEGEVKQWSAYTTAPPQEAGLTQPYVRGPSWIILFYFGCTKIEWLGSGLVVVMQCSQPQAPLL